MKKFGDFLKEDKDEKIAAHDTAWRELLQHEDLVHEFVEVLMNMIKEKAGLNFNWYLQTRSTTSKYSTPKPGDKNVYYELHFTVYSWAGSPCFFSEEDAKAYLESMKKIDDVYKLFKGGRGNLKDTLEKKTPPWTPTYSHKNNMMVSEITHNGVTSEGRKLCRLYGIDYWAVFNDWKENSNVRGILLGKDLDII